MKNTHVWQALFVLSVLLVSGCTDGINESTSGTSSTLERTGSTVSPTSSTAPTAASPTTKPVQAGTTTSPGTASSTLASNEPDGCAAKETALQRDACYLAAALASGNWTLCLGIEKNATRTLCLSGTEVETGGRSSTVQGYVVNNLDSRPIQDAVIFAVSQSNGKSQGTDRTDPRGFFSFDLPAMDHYNITVEYRGGRYEQEVFARKGETYVLWFRLPDSGP